MCKFQECSEKIFRVLTPWGVCYAYNMMTSGMIFTDVIHDDFKRITTKFSNESEPLWTPEKGFRDENINFPLRAQNRLAETFYPMLDKTNKENICNLKYFRVFIHKPNEIVTPLHEFVYLNYDEMINFRILPHSHRTDFSLKRFLPDLRKCYFEGERQLKFFKTYTKILCEWESLTNLTLERCNCVKFAMPRDNQTRVCSLSELECADKIRLGLTKCYSPCVDVTYTYKVEKIPAIKSVNVAKSPEQ